MMTKRPVNGTESMSYKEVSGRPNMATCMWKFTCHGPCQRTQYAGVSTDKFTVLIKLLHWRSWPAAVSYHSLTSH